MSAVLKKHSATSADESLEDELIDEIDNIDMDSQSGPKEQSTDSRWDALRGFNTED